MRIILSLEGVLFFYFLKIFSGYVSLSVLFVWILKDRFRFIVVGNCELPNVSVSFVFLPLSWAVLAHTFKPSSWEAEVGV